MDKKGIIFLLFLLSASYVSLPLTENQQGSKEEQLDAAEKELGLREEILAEAEKKSKKNRKKVRDLENTRAYVLQLQQECKEANDVNSENCIKLEAFIISRFI